MDILFKTAKLEKRCNSGKELVKAYGERCAGLLRRRLDDLEAADNLEVMWSLPGRCHELTGNLKGMLSLDLEHPYRLLFKVAHNPTPKKPDGGLDWSRVTKIEIHGIKDTHG